MTMVYIDPMGHICMTGGVAFKSRKCFADQILMVFGDDTIVEWKVKEQGEGLSRGWEAVQVSEGGEFFANLPPNEEVPHSDRLMLHEIRTFRYAAEWRGWPESEEIPLY